ncbi:MAG: tRNA1(Val) (adenine(37)-N6)-methyltransferase [Syntrophomonas sp.]|nr:tRNA1(Val) (adenine(37)-N6)-methyltransferase [Syntrophomonas sp.]
MTDQPGIISADETLDDLILGNMKIIQPINGYRFSVDAVLLAHFPEITGVKHIIDLGTGNGVIPLLLTARSNDPEISGIEIQTAMADRARRSVSFNDLAHRIKIIQQDIKEINKSLPGECAELVLSNPPFWKKGEGHINADIEEAIARHELRIDLEELVRQGAYLLGQGGKMAIIQRAERLAEAMELFKRYKIPVRRLQMIHSFIDRQAGLVLLEGHKNRPGNVTVLPPLIIYDKVGEFTNNIKKIYQAYAMTL